MKLNELRDLLDFSDIPIQIWDIDNKQYIPKPNLLEEVYRIAVHRKFIVIEVRDISST